LNFFSVRQLDGTKRGLIFTTAAARKQQQ